MIKLIFYEDFKDIEELEKGTYIFSDIECLDPVQTEQTLSCEERLFNSKGKNYLLNHPTCSIRPYELLRNLH